jgi:hypothetical protein
MRNEKTSTQAGERTQAVQLGANVTRINSDRSYNGKTGRVIEINEAKARARIEWTSGSPRTWVGFRFLQIN